MLFKRGMEDCTPCAEVSEPRRAAGSRAWQAGAVGRHRKTAWGARGSGWPRVKFSEEAEQQRPAISCELLFFDQTLGRLGVCGLRSLGVFPRNFSVLF